MYIEGFVSYTIFNYGVCFIKSLKLRTSETLNLRVEISENKVT